ncbi:hypothetical protein DOTSEDRAFT_84268 [Dothistroma septosporum NZE10]|uniref:Uncharacterized protein n=1 Tax=Dothistroma septosporum (strain NZE10 / CBS 128990) TaxID=675120 RepID=N1Q0C2_DOTSN|nr:hypothetical protein DOTSEDRAFT_84268 [Dothistroma septosporum NZE10]
MSSRPPQVDVFHFTNRISTAKIRKYRLATERGMAPGNGSAFAPPNGRLKNTSEQCNGMSEDPMQTPTPAAESSPDDQPPPAKKPRLKLNVRAKNDSPSDTIAVSRPRRDVKRRSYGKSVEQPEPEPVIFRKSQPSPAPSSGLSSLSSAPPSAPPSERAESPFMDPEPVEGEEYGDFLSYYVAGGPEPKSKSTKAAPTTKRKDKAESAKKAPAAHVRAERPVESSRDHAPQPAQSQAPQFPVQQHTHQHSLPITSQSQVHPQPSQATQQGGRPQMAPSYPRAPPVNQRPPPPRPIPIPQPVINFIDIVHDPGPMQPDTILVMIRKLENLSSALTNFGGVPAMPHTPPSEQPPQVMKPPKPTKAQKPAETGNGSKAPVDEVDTFLSIFDDGEDEDEDDELIEEEPRDPLDRHLLQPGMVDGPLSFGIQFIQNALKSWAQQRINHQVTQQFQAQHQQQMHQQQMQPVKRGPGRPRRYDDSTQQQTLGPIIHFDMANTPEGMAIKSFQSVLDCGCLQVNGILPVELSRALRRLYMQIDHLINQGVRDNTNWQCMSYGAQINAQKVRVEKWEEAAAKAEDELTRQRETGHPQHAMGPPTTERRSSAQYLAQQPYNAQQYSQPVQMASQPPGTRLGMASPRSPSVARQNALTAGVAGVLPAVSNAQEVFSVPQEQQRTGGGSTTGDAGSPIEIETDIIPQTSSLAVQPTRPITGGFTAVNGPPPSSQVRKDSMPFEGHDASSPETIKVAPRQNPGYASGSASPAVNQGNGMPGQGVMSRSNFPHPGAVVIDQ